MVPCLTNPVTLVFYGHLCTTARYPALKHSTKFKRNSMISFTLLTLVVVLVLLVVAVKHNGLSWLKTREGKGVLFGVFLAPLSALVIVAVLTFFLSGCSSNRYVEVYAGVEQTKKQSPMCEQGGASDTLTSNLGVSACDSVSSDGNTVLCATYRHHSCAITPDDQQYDAFGVTLNRRIYF